MTDIQNPEPEEKPVHEDDGWGGLVHVDVDPQIPTGICAICTWEPPYVYEEPVEETPEEPEEPTP